ncbi:formyl transferase [Mycena maculata]|uniref:methionyl-tRNA formyltransferase n=1 Tax=Mycena maculata TaxID=230809 RepID=A0AAD7IA90_9AGAR|nr:formyl transferase [Mycena maculata]
MVLLCRGLVLSRSDPCCARRHFRATTLQNRFKILFLGRDEFSCAIFEELHASPDVWESISVATNPDTRSIQSPLRPLAQSLNVPVIFIPPDKPDFKHWKPPPPFFESRPDHLLLTASFGRILTPAQLDLFPPVGRLNVHGSVLPAYRGPAPIQHAILDNAPTTGVSVAQMLKRGIDKGPVWGTVEIPVSPSATFTSLRAELAAQGGRLLVSVLRDMLAGTARSTPQPSDSPTPHARSITTADAILDFAAMTADDIVTLHRAIGHQRALTTWLPSGVRLHLYDPAIFPSCSWSSSSSPPPTLSDTPGTLAYYKPLRTLLIRCAAGSVLAVPRVQKEKRRNAIEAREFWNGMVPVRGLVVDGQVRLVRMEGAGV